MTETIFIASENVTENEEFLEAELPSDGVVEETVGAVVSRTNVLTFKAVLALPKE